MQKILNCTGEILLLLVIGAFFGVQKCECFLNHDPQNTLSYMFQLVLHYNTPCLTMMSQQSFEELDVWLLRKLNPLN